MKTFALLAALLSGLAFADSDRPTVEPTVSPGAVLTIIPPPSPLVVLPDGSLARGVAVRILAGSVAPFSGHLIDDQEHTRREKVNERNAAELAAYKDPSSLTLSKSQLFVIAAGCVVGGAAASAGIVLGIQAAQSHPAH